MMTKKLLLMSISLLWLLLAVSLQAHFRLFDEAAGSAGQPPAQWRQSPAVALNPAKPTLLMLVHPQCPCSRASLAELNHLAALCPDRAAMTVLFLAPPGCTQSWTQTGLWRQASAIPGVRVQADRNGETARRFGAVTSGETLLYAPNGRLLYRGGLTGERGHEGDNAGLLTVAALLRDQTTPGQWRNAESQPVYGCPLTAGRTVVAGEAWNAGGLGWLR